MWSRASRHRQQRHFRRLLRHITRIAAQMGNWLLVDAIVAEIARRETANGCAAIKHGQHVIPQTEYGQAGPGRSRTRGYVAVVGPITRYFPKEGRWTPHKRLGHITAADWRHCDACGGVAVRHALSHASIIHYSLKGTECRNPGREHELSAAAAPGRLPRKRTRGCC
jgi:hypothetical protein